MNNKLISKKKVTFPVTPSLQVYLDAHGRSIEIPVSYDDLLRFEGMPILDGNARTRSGSIACTACRPGRARPQFEAAVLHPHADGSDTILPFIRWTASRFALYNTKPFRVKARMSSTTTTFSCTSRNATLPASTGWNGATSVAEPHHSCLPEHLSRNTSSASRDIFIAQRWNPVHAGQRAPPKSTSTTTLLLAAPGDMRSYNYVVVITQDFDRIQYRLRAIDFDQQSYEGRTGLQAGMPAGERCPHEMTTTCSQRNRWTNTKEERSLLANAQRARANVCTIYWPAQGGPHLRGGQNRRAQRRAV